MCELIYLINVAVKDIMNWHFFKFDSIRGLIQSNDNKKYSIENTSDLGDTSFDHHYIPVTLWDNVIVQLEKLHSFPYRYSSRFYNIID